MVCGPRNSGSGGGEFADRLAHEDIFGEARGFLSRPHRQPAPAGRRIPDNPQAALDGDHARYSRRSVALTIGGDMARCL